MTTITARLFALLAISSGAAACLAPPVSGESRNVRSAPSSTAGDSRDAVLVEIDHDQVRVNGAAAPLVQSEKAKSSEFVSEKIRKVQTPSGTAQSYELRVGPGVLGSDVVRVMTAAGVAGFPDASFKVDGRKLRLHAPAPRPAGAPAPPWESNFPKGAVVLATRSDVIEIWRIPPSAGTMLAVSTVKTSDLPAGLSSVLARECSTASQCALTLFMIAPDMEFLSAARALALVAAANQRATADDFDVLVSIRPPVPVGRPPVLWEGACTTCMDAQPSSR